MVSFSDEKAQKDIPELIMKLKELLALTEEITKDKINYAPDEHFAFMLAFFICKQICHVKSILLLVENDHGRDAELIARSMIEGLTQILWTAKEPETRSVRWHIFAWICDWRLANNKMKNNETVDQKKYDEIEKFITSHCEEFLTKKSKEKHEKGEQLPEDPYCKYWHGYSYSYITKQVEGGQILHKELYKPFSDWHHWSPGGLGQASKRQQNITYFYPSSNQSSATALATAFQCLIQTAELIEEHLNLGFNEKIKKIKDEYIEQLSDKN